MKIDQTIEFFNQLTNEAQKSSERRRYRQFAKMLKELKEKDTSGKHTMIIERKLDEIQTQLLTPADRKKAMNGFRSFLNGSLRYVPVNQFVSLGVGVGLAFGTGLGVSIGVIVGQPDGIAIGAAIGSSVGLVCGLLAGRHYDKKAIKENRVLENL